MGRTVLPYSREIQALADERFKEFRRGLPKKHQESFDDIMRIAKNQLAAGVMTSNPYSIETVLLSALVELKTEFTEFKKNQNKNERDL